MRRGAEGGNFLGYSLGHYYMFGRHKPGAGDLWAEYQELRVEKGFDPEAVALAAVNTDTLGAKAVQEGVTGLRGAMGTPAQVREYLRRYEDCGVDQVILSCSTGRNRHEHMMESLELFSREVLPEFAERDEQAQRKKPERLAPVIAEVLRRKPASHHPDLDPDYEIPAYPRQDADRQEGGKFHRWLDDYTAKNAAGEDVSKRLA